MVEVLDVNDPPRFAQDNIAIGTSEVSDVMVISSKLEPCTNKHTPRRVHK